MTGNRWAKVIVTVMSASVIFLVFGSGAAAASYATLEKFSGEVMIKNAEEWLQPETGMALYSGAKIVTKDGTAFIVFQDGATLQVDPYSSIRAIDQVQSDTAQSSGEPARIRRLRIMLGRIKYEEQPIESRQTRVELPTAVAALRGTGGYFGTNESQSSQGSLYEGNMEIFGIFQEIVPQILELENALNSPTWTASLNSADQADNPLANVQEIQAELQTFAGNVDPEIREQVQQTLAMIEPIFSQIQEKLEKARESETQKARADQAVSSATADTPSQVTETNKLASETNQAFMETARESTKTDISLILETLKNNPDGIALAQQAKQRTDRAVEIAENAVVTAIQAAGLAAAATDEKQRDAAVSVARTAAFTTRTINETIKTTNSINQMLAKGDEEGLAKSGSLSNLADKTLAAAEKTSELATTALTLAQNPETAETAVNTARTAESSAGIIEGSARKTSRAARSLADNNPDADQLIEESIENEPSIDQIIQSLDEEGGEDDDGNADEDDGEEPDDETDEDEPAEDQDTEEQENPQERDFTDDDEPASPI